MAEPAATSDPASASKPTWKTPRAWVVLLSVVVLGIAADLWTKYEAFERVADAPVVVDRAAVVAATPRLGRLLPAHDPVTVVPGLLDFTLVLNPGAVFGIGAGQRWFFMVFTIAAVAFSMYIFAKWTRPRDYLAQASVGLLLAGGLGNLYDRWFYACVRDFIHPLPGVMWPWGISTPWSGREVWPYVSNVADLFLLIGIGVLMWKALFPPKGEAAAVAAAAK